MFRSDRGNHRSSGVARLVRPEFASIAPAVALAWYWFGPEGAAIVATAGLPLAYLAQARSHATVPAASELGTDSPAMSKAVETLQRAYETSSGSHKSFACLVVGLDDAPRLVESFGQSAYDKTMLKISERLGGVLRDHDSLIELDGARFAVALAPARRMDLETVIQIAGRLRAAIADPFSIDATTVYCSASIGFCLSNRAPEHTGKGLFDAAELAFGDALNNGPAAIRAFSAEIGKAAHDRETLRREIEAALECGEIVAYFQPQLSTDTGEIAGFEALARWQHPKRGILCPADFLPAIQEAGLSARLGEVILGHAFSALRMWDRAGIGVPCVSVNFSKAELRDPNLAAKLKWEFDRFDLAPERLTVEILESVVAGADDDVVVQNIAALSKLGCGIDLDDFGTGNASISAIRRFAVDRIKIDRSYVTHIDTDPAQRRMIAAVLSLAERLDLRTLAEGVESIAEHALLAQLGCSHVQGFAIARPMPVEATVEWLTKHRAKLAVTPDVGRRTG